MPRRAGPLIKTVKVKLHNPSKHKRAILDRVFLRWTLAADVTLRWAQEHLGAFGDCRDRRDNYRANLIASVLRQRVRLRIKRLGLHSSLEDALWRDIGKAIASYFERLKRDPNTGFPTIPHAKPNPARYEAALVELGRWGAEEQGSLLRQGDKETRGQGEGEKEGREEVTLSPPLPVTPSPLHPSTLAQLQAELLAAAGELELRARPIYFSRTDAVPRRRGYSILYDEERERYLALLYLLPRSASRRYRKPLTVRKPLLALNRHEEYLHETGYPSSALLFPLEMGSWQERTFFDLARNDPLAIRTAHLIREINRQGEVEYYLAIAVDFPQPKPVEMVNFLGVHHTLEGEVFALVADPEGEVLLYEQVAGTLELQDAYQQRRAWKRRGKRTPHRVAGERTDHHYHAASKRIVALAVEHRARVGVEDLSYRRTKTGRKAINRKRFAAPVGRLAAFLSYKLPFAGLLPPLEVRGISPRECHRCGKDSRDKTKRAEGRITCPLCGLEMDEHENTARLVAAQLPVIVEKIAAARQRRRKGDGETGREGEGEQENTGNEIQRVAEQVRMG